MTGPGPAVAAVRTAVRADLGVLVGAGAATTVPTTVPTTVLVAVSGGPDSLALAAATAFVAPQLGVRASALVVDHGLQPDSAAVADRAAEQCRGLGLPAQVRSVRPTGAGEAAARQVRYAAFEAELAATGAVAVLLGHTLDDQGEQVLLGLARGSGPRSLAGMPAVRGSVRRPLLGLRRATLAQACADQGIAPWHDPTNHPDGGGALRARVRHEVLPLLTEVLGPGIAEALSRTADQLRADAEVLEDLAADLLTAAAAPEHPAELDVATLAAAPTALRSRALRLALLGWGAPAGSLHAVHVAAVDALVTRWSGQGPVHVPGLAVARRCGRLAPHISTDGRPGGRG